jgi:hypothetical protein
MQHYLFTMCSTMNQICFYKVWLKDVQVTLYATNFRGADRIEAGVAVLP